MIKAVDLKHKIMKIANVNIIKSTKPVQVADCVVERGYWKVAHGSLPD